MKKYGKPADGILDYQEYLISEIDEHIKNEQKYEMRYKDLKKRKTCIVCNEKIESIDFTRNSISFSFCCCCGHLNGHHVLEESLADDIYTVQSDTEIKYDKYYIQEKNKFDAAVHDIYEPKAKFLADSLNEINAKSAFKKIKILDFGTGSGHMVKALQNVGFLNVAGIDPMSSTIEFGKKVMGIENLSRIQTSHSIDYLQATDAQIVSMICTLPHVTDPNAVLNAMQQNSKIEYTYQKLPMFSLGAILDISHPEINSRVISGTHTHLYTEESLKFIENKFQLERVSEWRFGADILDIYRNLQVSLNKKEVSLSFSQKFAEAFIPLIDALQLTLDKHNFASEIHILWKFKR